MSRVTNNLYVWEHDEKRVVSVEISLIDFVNTPDFAYFKYLVDARLPDLDQRYGMYVRNEDLSDWVHIPFRMFPKEFRANLLLMGIT